MTRTLQYFITLTFILLIVLMPSYGLLSDAFSYHDERRLVQLILLSAVFFWLMLASAQHTPLIKISMRTQWLILGILTCGAISSSLALSPRHAWLELSVFIGLSFAALFIANIYSKHPHRYPIWLAYAIWISITLNMATFYTGYITSFIVNIPMNWPVPISTFDNPRSFNQYQMWTWGVIALPLLAFNIQKNSTRLWLYIGMACWWVITYYSASRGAVLSWIIAIVLLAMVYRKLAWPFVKLQCIAHASGLLLFYVLFYVVPYLAGNKVNSLTIIRSTTSDRIALWNKAIALVQQHPWFGVGPMHYAWNNAGLSHPHNSLLQMVSEWGLLATGFMLAFILYALLSWLTTFSPRATKSLSPINQHIAIALTFTLLINACYSMVDGVIVMPISQMMMALMMGCAIGLYANVNKLDQTITAYKRPILAAVILCVMVWAIAPEIIDAMINSTGSFSSGFPAVGPRFWDENVVKFL